MGRHYGQEPVPLAQRLSANELVNVRDTSRRTVVREAALVCTSVVLSEVAPTSYETLFFAIPLAGCALLSKLERPNTRQMHPGRPCTRAANEERMPAAHSLLLLQTMWTPSQEAFIQLSAMQRMAHSKFGVTISPCRRWQERLSGFQTVGPAPTAGETSKACTNASTSAQEPRRRDTASPSPSRPSSRGDLPGISSTRAALPKQTLNSSSPVQARLGRGACGRWKASSVKDER